MPRQQVIIIGAGIAGLACAARLAARGLRVSVYERNDYTGGKLGLLQDGGYSWDTGPSLFTQPQLLESLFTDCGAALKDFLTYRQLADGTQYFWDDGARLHAASQPERLAANAAQAFGVPAGDILRYLEDAGKLYKDIGSIFLDEPIHRLNTWKPARIFPALKTLKLAYLTQTLHNYNTRRLAHPKLVQMMDRLATYNGSDPYQCPAMLSTIAHLEFGEGCWYPEGGMIAIARALRSLCEQSGVVFHTGTPVIRITCSKGVTSGIDIAGGHIEADAVVSNSDVFFTYRDLLRDAQAAQRIRRQERSSSGVIFYWGIRHTFPQLGLHNVFFSEDYRKEFRQIFDGFALPSDPTVYLNITARQDAAHAPADCENWFVLVNAPAREQPLGEEELSALREAVLRKLSRILGINVASLIEREHRLGPADIERSSGAYLGALYGTASNSPMAAFARHPNFSKTYRGLFFAGGTVHPGGGIPLCLRSGKLAANEVVHYLRS